jgi:quercetin dioxygenase-like cupin family protein
LTPRYIGGKLRGMKLKTISIVTLLGAACAFTAMRASAEDAPAGHMAMGPAEMKWGDAPPNLPKGGKMAVLYGDPSKPGLFIARLKMPAGYKIMPHTHPSDENVTVISGAIAIGMGDAVDPKTKAMPAGSFISLPKGMHHYAFSKAGAVVEISAMGPFAINYLNPADDPSKTAAPVK